MNENDELARRVAERKQSILESVAVYERKIASLREEMDTVGPKLAELYETKKALEAAGFDVHLGSWSDTLTVDVEPNRLTDVYKVVGRLDGRNKSVSLVDARKRLVEVRLPAAHKPFVHVVYRTKLPKGARCKIVTEKVKARTEARLVCDL